MSAFATHPHHFLDWVMKRDAHRGKDTALVAQSFLPRYMYGEYLAQIWTDAQPAASSAAMSVQHIDGLATDLECKAHQMFILLDDGKKMAVDYCVIASGNHVPGNPIIKNASFFESNKYFRNPWKVESVTGVDASRPVLIIGNGLTMVDTVIGLLEHGFHGGIFSISPNGFNILPHRHSGLKYEKFLEELQDDFSLGQIVSLVNKHVKAVRHYGISAEPVIDSLRPHTQRLWQKLTAQERKLFMARLRHLWGVARHRIPLHIHDRLQQLRLDEKLHIVAGKLMNIEEKNNIVSVEYLDKKLGAIMTLNVSRVINCTGPQTDITKLENTFLSRCMEKGMVMQDELKLGIRTNTRTYEVLDKKGERQNNLFTLGSNLKGELWESTAVSELRVQAEQLAKIILSRMAK